MTAGHGIFSLLLIASTAATGARQLQKHPPVTNPCPEVAIQITAKQPDGSSYTSLQTDDVHTFFPEGTSRVTSLTSFSRLGPQEGITNILFVLPPLHSFGAEPLVHDVLSTLAHADNFRFRAAILGPNGTLTPFTNDLAALQRDFKTAATARSMTSFSEWVRTEEKAYLALRHTAGRRIIVRLFYPDGPEHSRATINFAADYSMDSYATLDGAQVYRLVQPVNPGAAIPFGEAASEPQAAFGPPGSNQLAQVQDTSSAQSALWANKAMWNLRTSGRAEENAKALIEDLIRDNASTYLVTVQPFFACPDPARFRRYASPPRRATLCCSHLQRFK